MASPVGKVLGGPVKFDGEVVRIVAAAGDTIAAETWRNGSWVRSGDPSAVARGRELSPAELSALGIPSET